MDVSVSDNSAESRFEARVDGELAGFAAYRTDGSTIVFTHTEVESQHEGQGVASTLIRQALDEVRDRDLLVRPLCSFVRSYIERHPPYRDLVAG